MFNRRKSRFRCQIHCCSRRTKRQQICILCYCCLFGKLNCCAVLIHYRIFYSAICEFALRMCFKCPGNRYFGINGRIIVGIFNITYGYLGKAAGFPSAVLKGGSMGYHILNHGMTEFKNEFLDEGYIQLGVDWYEGKEIQARFDAS